MQDTARFEKLELSGRNFSLNKDSNDYSIGKLLVNFK